MVTSIVSVITGIPVRKDVAMTGEVTLRGRVLPIGGLKEKLLAALRGGLTTVLIPHDNVKDLEDIPENVKRDLNIISVATVDDVLKNALVRLPEAIEWKDPKDTDGAAVPAAAASDDENGVSRTH
jgi:ATP-dependent Lon protease